MTGRDTATGMLTAARRGDRAAVDRLVPLVYDELRDIAAAYLRHEAPDPNLQPTALVHQAYLRLIDLEHADEVSRTHFAAIAANVLRRVLVDEARAREAEKRGHGWKRITLGTDAATPASTSEIDVLALEELLARLAELDERQARVVELRFFAGLSVDEVAALLGVSKRTVEADWTLARAWLERELSRGRA